MAEALNILMSRTRNLGLMRGVKIGAGEEVLSHLQFADDTMIFCEADRGEILTIKRILRCFELMSGLKINFHKSCVCGVGVEDSVVEGFADILRCKSQKLPFTYLGLPLGASPSRLSTWKPVIEKFKLKLASWERKLLSYSGRVTLIKAVLNSLPVYYLSLFKMPEGVAKILDRVQAAFLWGGAELKRKLHIVKWGEVTKSRLTGGLGIKDIREFNDCLLAKWWWRFAKEDNAMWKIVLCAKYASAGGNWFPFVDELCRLSTVWRGILAVARRNSDLGNFYLANCLIIPRNGH